MSKVTLGFVPEPKLVAIDKILPSRKVPEGLAVSRKFKQIQSSIAEIGLIEPLTVAPLPGGDGQYTLLDGHMRMHALRALGLEQVPCLEALDDEGYTYNNRINRLSSVQEHHMIRRALDRGVSAERLAKVLNVDITQVRKKQNLLDGICPEAASLLEGWQFSAELMRVVRKMKPTRQVETLELMMAANNLTVTYAEALLAATPPEMLVDGKKPSKMAGVTREQMARMEREMASVQGQYKMVEQSYGQDVLTLVLVKGYLTKLVANEAVARYLKGREAEIFEQFEAIAVASSLET